MLLELLTGRRAVDKAKVGDEQNLVDWIKQFLGHKRKVFRIMDTKLEGQYPHKEAITVTGLALSCISEAKVRPPMSKVLSTLEELHDSREASSPSKTELKMVRSPYRKSPLRNGYASPVKKSPRPSPLQTHMKSPLAKSPRGR